MGQPEDKVRRLQAAIGEEALNELHRKIEAEVAQAAPDLTLASAWIDHYLLSILASRRARPTRRTVFSSTARPASFATDSPTTPRSLHSRRYWLASTCTSLGTLPPRSRFTSMAFSRSLNRADDAAGSAYPLVAVVTVRTAESMICSRCLLCAPRQYTWPQSAQRENAW